MNKKNENVNRGTNDNRNKKRNGETAEEKVTVTESKPVIKSFEELEFKDDFIFGVIMRNPKYCKPFLETILGIKISGIKYPKTQEAIDIAANSKSVRLDVYVEDEENTVYNIEMQITVSKNLPKRSRYYQGMIDLNILEKGEDYINLKRSYVIFICTFDLLGKGRHMYTFENRCLQDMEISFGDGTTKIILNTKGTMNDVSPEMKNLLDYIDGKEAADEFTRKLETAVKSVKNNEKWRMGYMTLEMRYRELLEQGIDIGRSEGIDIGRSEGMEMGLEQEKIQTALRMLHAGKLSIEEIALYSGLTIEKVSELKDSLKE